MPTELDALFEKNISSLAESLNKAVQRALNEYEQLQEYGLKGEVSYVYISFILSSLLCKLPWLRIDLCDENDRNDMVECFADWDVPQISEKLYDDADKLAKQSRMKDYELDKIWLDVSTEYCRCFEEFLPKIIGRCAAVQTVSCQWHFGQFLGSTVVVWEKS